MKGKLIFVIGPFPCLLLPAGLLRACSQAGDAPTNDPLTEQEQASAGPDGEYAITKPYAYPVVPDFPASSPYPLFHSWHAPPLLPASVPAAAAPVRAAFLPLVHAGMGLSRPLARVIWTFFKNAKLIFPLRAVETASITILVRSATVGFVPVKSRFLLYKAFKCPFLALREEHSGCASFLRV